MVNDCAIFSPLLLSRFAVAFPSRTKSQDLQILSGVNRQSCAVLDIILDAVVAAPRLDYKWLSCEIFLGMVKPWHPSRVPSWLDGSSSNRRARDANGGQRDSNGQAKNVEILKTDSTPAIRRNCQGHAEVPSACNPVVWPDLSFNYSRVCEHDRLGVGCRQQNERSQVHTEGQLSGCVRESRSGHSHG